MEKKIYWKSQGILSVRKSGKHVERGNFFRRKWICHILCDSVLISAEVDGSDKIYLLVPQHCSEETGSVDTKFLMSSFLFDLKRENCSKPIWSSFTLIESECEVKFFFDRCHCSVKISHQDKRTLKHPQRVIWIITCSTKCLVCNELGYHERSEIDVSADKVYKVYKEQFPVYLFTLCKWNPV